MGNLCTDTQTPKTQKYGIYLTGGGSQYNLVSLNNTYGNKISATQGILDEASVSSAHVANVAGYINIVDVLGDAGKLGFFRTAAIAKPTVTGIRASNTALASTLTQLAALGLVTDSTTAT
jgi:hypothetical protein